MGWFNRKSLKRIRTLIGAIRVGEFNLHFNSTKLRGQEKMLVEELNAVVDDFRLRLTRQEEVYGSYQAMLDQVDVSLLSINSVGKVLWMNRKAIDELCGYAIDNLSSLEAVYPEVVREMEKLQPGQQRLIFLTKEGQPNQLKISMVRYIQASEAIRLFSLENIQQVIQHTQTQAQNKLISVLTHEIMNSLSPIISLSETMLESMRLRQQEQPSSTESQNDDNNTEGEISSNDASDDRIEPISDENLMAMEIINSTQPGTVEVR